MLTTGMKIEQQDCARCGGLMVEEGTRETGMILSRCVLCGERVDPVILQHRQTSLSREEADKRFVRAQKAPLN